MRVCHIPMRTSAIF